MFIFFVGIFNWIFHAVNKLNDEINIENALNGKAILITGASKGLGYVAANSLAASGAKLALLARSKDKLEALRSSIRNPSSHVVIPVDLLDVAEINCAVVEAQRFHSGIDVVLHCLGGVLGLRDDLLQYQDFLRLFSLNLGAAAEINRLVVPDMKIKGSGNLVHVGSIASIEGVGSVGYNTVKAALAGYVRSVGRELNKFNVIATGILPGGFTGPENAMERLAQNNPLAYEEFVQTRLPRAIMGNASELIPMIHLLCSSKASMMGGCLVPIDAGEGRAYNL